MGRSTVVRRVIRACCLCSKGHLNKKLKGVQRVSWFMFWGRANEVEGTASMKGQPLQGQGGYKCGWRGESKAKSSWKRDNWGPNPAWPWLII